MLKILTDRGTEYCGKVEQHDYQLYLAINDIDHTKTRRCLRRRMASANASIKPFFRNCIRLRSAKSYMQTWKA